MKTNLFVCLVFLAMGSQALAIENRLTKCVKVISTLRRDHSIPTLSGQYTKASLELLHLFRSSELSKFEYIPGNDAVIASSESSKREKKRVTRRLTAVLSEGNSTEIDPVTGLGIKQTFWASSFSGERNIRAVLLDRLRFEDKIIEENMAFLSSQGLAIGLIRPVVGGVMAYLGNYTLHSLNPVTGFLAFYNRHFPEMAIRGLNSYNYGRRSETRAKNALKQITQTGSWFYQSFDQKVSQEVGQRVMYTGDISGMDLSIFFENTSFPVVTAAVTGTGFMNHPPRPLDPSSWLRFDELIYFDPISKEPVMIDVVRFIENIPPYPKTVPEQEKSRLKSLSPATVEVPR